MAMERVVITGIGLVTPVATGTMESWRALLAGQSGVAPITLFDTTDFRVRIAGEVKNWDPLQFMEKKKLKEMDRFAQFAVGAAYNAIRDAQLELADEERDEAGCFIGVGLGGLQTLERAKQTLLEKGPQRISPYSIPGIIANMAAGQVSMAHGLRGPSYCTTSACSSGAHALGEATEWIRRGRCQVMVAGGAEATVSPVGIGSFEAMMALSRRNDDPTRASRPWDKGRDGFVCGEGSGVLVLESLTRAKKRGARIYAEITGYGASSDAYHLTQPAPNGEGAQRSMRMALKDAGVATDQVDYINAHGTSTPVGDVEESRAIEAVFGDHARSKKLWISSTKSMMGHLLGAAGAVESAICALTIAEGKIPPPSTWKSPTRPACSTTSPTSRASGTSPTPSTTPSASAGPTAASCCRASRARSVLAVRCPFCSHMESKVIDSRLSTPGDVTRRRRECERCARRFTTYERVEDVLPLVAKKDMRREPYDRQKLLAGVRKACDKRAVPQEKLEELLDGIERELAETGEREVSSLDLGEKVMLRLRDLDEVAYVRFASVYRSFRDIAEFQAELDRIAQQKREESDRPPPSPEGGGR